MADLIDRQAALDALDVLCQEQRYKIPGKRETYSQYNEAWQDALDRAEGAIGNLPPAQPEHGRWLHGREVSRDYIGDACVTIHYEKWWCSKCNYTVDGRPLWNYCPNCGASNEVEE